MKFCQVVFAVARLKNLCHTEGDIFLKQSNSVQKTLKHIDSLETAVENFQDYNNFFIYIYIYIEENKKEGKIQDGTLS